MGLTTNGKKTILDLIAGEITLVGLYSVDDVYWVPTLQAIGWDDAVGATGTVSMDDTPVVFNIPAGTVVDGITLNDSIGPDMTDIVATQAFVDEYGDPTPFTFTNAGTFTLTSVIITLSNV